MKRYVFSLLSKNQQHWIPNFYSYAFSRYYHETPFFQLYHQITGKLISNSSIPKLKKQHPNLVTVSQAQLEITLQMLQKFGITPLEACENPHLFSMNPITMDNYGEILKECGFHAIAPIHIFRYHTIVRSRTISQLKKQGLLQADLKLEDMLHKCFQDWPASKWISKDFPDTTTSILTVRIYVLEKYLQWRLSVTEKDFQKYCKNYLPLKHRPMCDIKEALDIAINDIKFDVPSVKRNGFLISSDPVNTKLILENVDSLGGLDIREAIKVEPGILKNNYHSLLKIKEILEEFKISREAQRHCMRIFCLAPDTVRDRLLHLSSLKEYKVLFSNPRILSMVVHKVKVLHRLEKIQQAKKQCYSLNNLIASRQIFNSYISSFGNKACGRDIGILISSSLSSDKIKIDKGDDVGKTKYTSIVLSQLRRHKYWLHTALNVIDENIQFLKRYFDDTVIFNNCHLLLYPAPEIRNYINYLLERRQNGKSTSNFNNIQLDSVYNTLNYKLLTDHQVLSLVLYEIEKKHHFSGDGIWNKLPKTETEEFNRQAHANVVEQSFENDNWKITNEL